MTAPTWPYFELVVDTHDLVSASEQLLHDVTADEARRPGHQDARHSPASGCTLVTDASFPVRPSA